MAPATRGSAESSIETDAVVVRLSYKDLRDLLRDQHTVVFGDDDTTARLVEKTSPYAYFYLNGGEYSGTDYRQLLSEHRPRGMDTSEIPSPEYSFNVTIRSLQRLLNGERVGWGEQGETSLYVEGTDVSEEA